MRSAPLFATAVLATAALAGCQEDIAASWNDIISKCAKTDLLGNSYLFFGMSNNVGPGSVWRATDTDGFNLRWLPKDLDGTIDIPPSFVQLGSTSNCSGQSKTLVKFSPSLLLESKLSPATGELKAALKAAREVTVNVDGWSFDQLREGPFEVWSGSLSDDKLMDLREGNRLVMVKAIKISGISADLEFDRDLSSEVRAELAESELKIGTLGVAFQADWESTTSLKLRSNSPFYIAGEFSRLEGGEFPVSKSAKLPSSASEDFPTASGEFPASGPTASNDNEPVLVQQDVIEIPESAKVGWDRPDQ